MEQVVPLGTAGTLEELHQRLDIHFRALGKARRLLGADTPVFALEHGTSRRRSQASPGCGARRPPRRVADASELLWWLPLMVHAAEVGYITTAASSGRFMQRRHRGGTTVSMSATEFGAGS